MGIRPVSEECAPGREFEGQVRNLSSEGKGVVNHPGGMTFFVDGAWPGDRAIFEIERNHGRYGHARLKQLLAASPDRRPAPCPHQGAGAGFCGGCPWMIGTYPSQLNYKEHRLRHALERAGLLAADPLALKPIEGSPSEWGYRNRAQFKTDGERLGFVSAESHELVEVNECRVLNPAMSANLARLRARLPEPAWKPGDGYVWNYIDVDEESDLAQGPVLNRRRPFRQGNSPQNQRMRERLAEWLAGLAERDFALELYCGSGNFTEILSAAGFQKTLAIEVNDAALVELRNRRLPGVQARALDLTRPENFRSLVASAAGAQVLVLDPPREGAKGIERLALALPALREIHFISCDIATFTRDAAALVKAGFGLVEARPLDLFPQTAHVEVMSRFRRGGA